MATAYGPLLAFNRGVISKTSLARTDLDRTRLSAEIMTNFLPKTQGPMILRPGTKYLGSSINDTGAAWIDFVASTSDLALLEMTANKMRIWLPSDTGNASHVKEILQEPSFDAATGWVTGTQWAISGGNATRTGGVAGNMYAEIAGAYLPGETYTLSVEITSIDAALKLEFYQDATPTGVATAFFSTTGTHTARLVAPAGATRLYVIASTIQLDCVLARVSMIGASYAWETPVAGGLEVPLARPAVSTTLSIADTGWDNLSNGGSVTAASATVIPAMSAETTNRVKITASSSNLDGAFGGRPWQAADQDTQTDWMDTGSGNNTLPSWWNVNFDTGAKSANYIAVRDYSIRSGPIALHVDNAPRSWRLLASNFDTGTFATDTGKWTLEDERSAQIDWAVSEKRTFTLPGADTGTIEARRHWRLYVTAVDTGNPSGNNSKQLTIGEVEMFDTGASGQQFIMDATARGFNIKLQKRVVVDTGDRDVEHSLDIQVSRGPVTLRTGSSADDDDYVSETDLGTGYHNLAFTPSGDFYVVLKSYDPVDRIVERIAIGDSGTVEITTPWAATDLDQIRFDQSADVVYVDCLGVKPYKIERRGTGRSWSVVAYEPDNGPFLAGKTSKARLSVAGRYGNTTMHASQPFFKPSHVGSLFEITHEGQSGRWLLGLVDSATDVIEVTGISDTGTPGTTNERRLTISASGTYAGQITIERSFDGPDFGFKRVTSDYVTTGSAQDTGTFTTVIDDRDDNVTVFYRARRSAYTSGTATITATYNSGSVTGVARVTSYTDNREVSVEVIDQFSDTGSSENWREGAWSERRGYPSAVALHEGRLAHAGNANIWLTVSDDYENFDDEVEGESAPIARTLGSGPVNTVQYLLSLLRLIVGTTGSEIALKASSLDETLTATNAAASTFSTQGSATLRAVKLDNKGLFVQRSGKRLYMYGFGISQEALNDYESQELTILAPDILSSGVVSVAIQRQPDTRIHCVLADGTVAILTYEPQEEVLAWSKWVTDTGSNSAVEKAVVLPGEEEDTVYYHVRRTIKGVTRRFLEKWALESECQGDTGLSWLADCAVSKTDTGGTLIVSDFAPHLGGQTITVWANDTGQGNSVGKDMTPDDTGGDQQLLSLDTGGDLTLTDSGWKHLVGGLPYRADFKSTKLAYGAQGSTAMTMRKRIDRLALVLHQTHNNALFVGSDTGHLDPIPRVAVNGTTVDANHIYPEYDKFGFPFNGDWDEDSRLYIRGKAPRPATIMAALPRVTTNEN